MDHVTSRIWHQSRCGLSRLQSGICLQAPEIDTPPKGAGKQTPSGHRELGSLVEVRRSRRTARSRGDSGHGMSEPSFSSAEWHEKNKAATIAQNHEPTPAHFHITRASRLPPLLCCLLSRCSRRCRGLCPTWLAAEGMTVLGAKMGMGKSYFLLQLAVALSTGTPFLGRGTRRQSVLFMALEDSERRVYAWLNQLGAIGTDKLIMHYRWAKGKGALEDLRLILACKPKLVVIVDPIVKFLDLVDFNDYGGAYGALGPLKDAMDARHVAGIFSHHCKKSVAELDAFDDLLGSTGLGGACDTRLVLRGSVVATTALSLPGAVTCRIARARFCSIAPAAGSTRASGGRKDVR